MGQLLAALFAIVLGIAGVPLFLQYQQASNDSVIASVTAQQAQIMNTAVTGYILQNSSTLQASATASSPSTITVDMFKSAGFLPSAFSATNPYGQTWTAFVLQPSSGNLQALVSTTGGTAIKDRIGLKIASLIGAVGGFVPTNDSQAYITPGTGYANAYGAFGGWVMQVGVGSFGVTTGGRPASLLSFFNGALQNNYLYRNAVSGQPQLNTMNTPLVMASTQTLNSACTTTGAIAQDGTGKLLSCQSGVWKNAQSSLNIVSGSACSNPSDLQVGSYLPATQANGVYKYNSGNPLYPSYIDIPLTCTTSAGWSTTTTASCFACGNGGYVLLNPGYVCGTSTAIITPTQVACLPTN